MLLTHQLPAVAVPRQGHARVYDFGGLPSHRPAYTTPPPPHMCIGPSTTIAATL